MQTILERKLTLSIINSLKYSSSNIATNRHTENEVWQDLATENGLTVSDREQPKTELVENSGSPNSMNVSDEQMQAILANSGKSSTVKTKEKDKNVEDMSQSEKSESLLNKLFEQLLANRLGIDKKRMDDIKQKLKELEALKQELMKMDSQTPSTEKQLKMIDEKMMKLNEELENLVKEATERELIKTIQSANSANHVKSES